MMRQLRQSTKWIMLATALAFVGLMVFEWGMDATGQSGTGVGSLGRVNGVSIPFDLYENTRRNLYDQAAAAQAEPITSQQNSEIEDQAWEEVINQVLISEELERRGIVVTDDEIRSAAQFSPPPALQSDAAFQTEGAFDLQKYQTWLAGLPPDVLLQLEDYYRSVIPRGKLLRQVGAGIYPSDGELWQAWRDQYERATIRFVALDPTNSIADVEVSVSDAEVESFYDDNQDEFEMPARARLAVTVIGKAPTAADTLAAMEEAEQIRQFLLDGEDFAALAEDESADQGSASLGGSLGTFPKGRMVAVFDSAVWAAPIGEVTEPVKSSFGWHLIRVDERWEDSATASHILIPNERTDASEIALLTLADSLEVLAEDMQLSAAAQVLSLPTDTIELNEDFPFASGAGRIGEGMDWAIEEAEIGDASPVFETSEAFYALQLLDKSPAGILPYTEAQPIIEARLRTEKKMALAAERAGAALAQAGGSLDAFASAMGLEVKTPEPFSRSDFVPGLGRQNAAIGVAFGMPPGQLSAPIQTDNDVVVLEVVGVESADRELWEQQRDTQRAGLQQQLASTRLQDWMDGLRADARIVDRRADVLRPAGDDDLPLATGPFGF